jgi:hypothetical protein
MIGNSNTIVSESLSSNAVASLFADEQKDKGKPEAVDIFTNLDALRLSSDAAAFDGTSEILSHTPVRKPNRHEFFRTRPEPDFWFDTGVFEDKEERETFFVTPKMRDALAGEIKPVLLVPTITRQGVLILWPLKLPTEGQRHNGWMETAREAAELGKTKMGKTGGGYVARRLPNLSS